MSAGGKKLAARRKSSRDSRTEGRKRASREAGRKQNLQLEIHVERFEESNELAFISEQKSGKTRRIIQLSPERNGR